MSDTKSNNNQKGTLKDKVKGGMQNLGKSRRRPEDVEVEGTKHSSYWLNSGGNYQSGSNNPTGSKVVNLSILLRSITNFVRIAAKKDIPVAYMNTKNKNATFGNESGAKVVLLSADIDKNVDSGVGLALHEGAHALKTDFGALVNIKTNLSLSLVMQLMNKWKNTHIQLRLCLHWKSGELHVSDVKSFLEGGGQGIN